MKSCCLSPPRKIRFLNLLWVLLVCGISKWLKNACLFVFHLVKENWKNICVYGCLPIILYKCCVSVSPFVCFLFFPSLFQVSFVLSLFIPLPSGFHSSRSFYSGILHLLSFLCLPLFFNFSFFSFSL